MTPKLQQILDKGDLKTEEYIKHLEYALNITENVMLKRSDFTKEMFVKFSISINLDANEIYNALVVDRQQVCNELHKLKTLHAADYNNIFVDDGWSEELKLVRHLGITKEFVLEVMNNIYINRKKDEILSVYDMIGIAKSVVESGGIEAYNKQRHQAALNRIETEEFEREIKKILSAPKDWD